MALGGGGGELGDGGGAGGPDAAGLARQERVPLGELGRCATPVGDAAQQRVALADGALVARERDGVGAIGLADGEIEVAAAQARLAGQQLEIERAEEHGADRAERLTGLARHTVDADALARERGAGLSRGAVGSGRDHDLDRDRALLRFGIADEPHELWGGGIPGDQLAFAGGAQRAERGEHPTRFDQVGLAGGVGTADEVEAAFERQIERPPGAKLVEPQPREMHGASLRAGGG